MNKSHLVSVLEHLIRTHPDPEIRGESGMGNQNEIARRADIHQPTLQRILSGASKEPRDSTIRPLAEFFGVTIPQLRGHEPLPPAGEAAAPPPRFDANVGPAPDSKGMVPLISWVQAGAWSDIADPYVVGDAEEWLPCPVGHGPRTFAVRVRGQSMYNPGGEKSYKDGDIIYVDPDRHACNKSMVVVRLDDRAEATFKQLVIEGEERYLMALNPAWPERIMRVDERATICGVVVAKLVLE